MRIEIGLPVHSLNLKPGEALGHAVPFTLLARIECRFWHKADNPDRVRKDVAELVALAPDVVIITSSLPAKALQRTTRTVPIVFVLVADPVGSGIADSMARPGGNATGFYQFEYTTASKYLELLKVGFFKTA